MAYNPNADTAIFNQTADKTITNTTTETSALGTGVGSQIIKANTIQPGRRLRIHGEGIYSIPLALTTNLVIRVKVGSVVVATVTTTALLLGATNKAFTFDVLVVFRTTGVNGTCVAGGSACYTSGLGTKTWDDLDNAGVASTVDTTVDNMVDVTVTWNAASASRSLTTTIANIMLV